MKTCAGSCRVSGPIWEHCCTYRYLSTARDALRHSHCGITHTAPSSRERSNFRSTVHRPSYGLSIFVKEGGDRCISPVEGRWKYGRTPWSPSTRYKQQEQQQHHGHLPLDLKTKNNNSSDVPLLLRVEFQQYHERRHCKYIRYEGENRSSSSRHFLLEISALFATHIGNQGWLPDLFFSFP
jgi:hypothetical protein